MRILLTGSTGFVGTCFYRSLKEEGIDVWGLARSGAQINTDLTSLDFSFVQSLPGITHVIHTAALSNVEYCEQHPDESYLANVAATERLVEALPGRPKFIFLSTDYVYDGVRGGYDEESPTNPLNVYGRDKLAAEKLILKASSENLVLRITVATGWDRRKKNFSTKLITGLRSGEAIRVPSDQVSNPSFTDELAGVIVRSLREGLAGLFIAGGPESVSRYDFALRIARKFGLPEGLIEPVLTSSLGQIAKRPLNSRMSSARLQKVLGIRFRRLDDSLDWLRKSETAYGGS